MLLKDNESAYNSSSDSEISILNPISEISDTIPQIKSYSLSLKDWNPEFYTDKTSHYKKSYFRELRKNQALLEEIATLKKKELRLSKLESDLTHIRNQN